MDNATLDAAFNAHKEAAIREGKPFTRRMAVTLADMASMNPKGLVLRLERMSLLRPGTWEWFEMNGGITPDQIKQIRLERQQS